MKAHYNKIRNEIQRDIRRAKAGYLRNSFDKNMGKPKKLWQQLKNLGYSNKCKVNTNIVLRIASKICYDTHEICNYINTFFTTIASNLVNKQPPSIGTFSVNSQLFKNFYSSQWITPGNLILQPVSLSYIQRELRSMNPLKATRIDGISPRFLKDGAEQLGPILCHVFKLIYSS